MASKKRTVSSAAIGKDQLIPMYKEMLFYRRFEERVNQAYMKQKFSGFCHLHIGQEAVCVGVGHALKETDYMISGYRSHTQAISKGIDAKSVFAELLGKSAGCSGGKGGSMHMFGKKARFLGGHGIVGGQAPLAVGAGFAIKYRGGDDVVLCYLGDAALNQGAVFEAMNMASVWKLPVLFFIENNRYGMGTDISRTTSIKDLCRRADAFDMKNSQVDGMSLSAVYSTTCKIVEEMRVSKEPYLLEAKTFRFKGHSVSDPGNYRSKEELKRQMNTDPLISVKAEILSKKYATSEEIDDWDQAAKQRSRDAEAFAEKASVPEGADLWKDVYADERAQ